MTPVSQPVPGGPEGEPPRSALRRWMAAHTGSWLAPSGWPRKTRGHLSAPGNGFGSAADFHSDEQRNGEVHECEGDRWAEVGAVSVQLGADDDQSEGGESYAGHETGRDAHLRAADTEQKAEGTSEGDDRDLRDEHPRTEH